MATAREVPFKHIKFTVDVALLRELGERLVGKPHVALAELVKNSYDADARRCRISFDQDEIEVCDDGNGMSYEEFAQFWMRIGTTHKQRTLHSPRFNRTVTGSKGIGRLSVQFLGRELELWTVDRSQKDRALHAKIDWSGTYELESISQAGADYRLESSKGALPTGFRHGTRIVIRGLNQEWSADNLQELARELWFLQPPTQIRRSLPSTERFAVRLIGVEEDALERFENQMTAALENWTAKIEGGIEDGIGGGVAHVKVSFRGGESFETKYPLPHGKLDKAQFSIRVFNLAGKQEGGVSVQDARDYLKKYGGVHVYDSDFRLPFYGGEAQDWLRLEIDHSHRLIISKLLPESLQVPNGMRDLPTLGRVYGAVDVSTAAERRKATPADREKGNYLNIQVTRDRLIDNEPYEDLVHLVRYAFHYYAMRVAEVKQRKAAKEIAKSRVVVESALHGIRSAIAQIEDKLSVKELSRVVERIKEFEEAEQQRNEGLANERILLAALATAGMGAVALTHELSKEVTALRDSVKKLSAISSGAESKAIGEVVKSLEEWIDRSTETRLLFSPLMNEADRNSRARLRARKIVDRVVHASKPLLRGADVNTENIPRDLRLPQGTMAGWHAVIQNVLMNSVNAMLDSRAKKINISGGSERSRNYILIQDTGVGVELGNSERLFQPFVRELEISEERRNLGLGGVGLGLTIVRMVSDSVGCKTEFVVPARPFKTAFKMSWKAGDDE